MHSWCILHEKNRDKIKQKRKLKIVMMMMMMREKLRKKEKLNLEIQTIFFKRMCVAFLEEIYILPNIAIIL